MTQPTPLSQPTLGVLQLTQRPVTIPGSMGNPASYAVPVRFQQVPEASPERVLGDGEGVAEGHIRVAQQFEREGVAAIISGFDERAGQYELYMVEPSGVYFKYHGCSAGKGRRACATAIERLEFSKKTCQEAMKDVAKLLEQSHDEVKDKPFKLELAVLCDASGREHQIVADADRDAALDAAKAEIEKEEEDEDED